MKYALFALLSVFISISPASAAPSCDAKGSCTIASGRYMRVEPDGWDHKSPLGMIVFFHGYNQEPDGWADKSYWLAQFANEKGALLVVPEGKDKTWSYPGSPMENRDDTSFVADILDRKSTRLNSSHVSQSRMPSSA